MKLYSPKEFRILIDFKSEIDNREVKNALEKLLYNYNIMYLNFKEYIHKKDDMKQLYVDIEKVQKENRKLNTKLQKLEKQLKAKDELIEELQQNNGKILED